MSIFEKIIISVLSGSTFLNESSISKFYKDSIIGISSLQDMFYGNSFVSLFKTEQSSESELYLNIKHKNVGVRALEGFTGESLHIA